MSKIRTMPTSKISHHLHIPPGSSMSFLQKNGKMKKNKMKQQFTFFFLFDVWPLWWSDLCIFTQLVSLWRTFSRSQIQSREDPNNSLGNWSGIWVLMTLSICASFGGWLSLSNSSFIRIETLADAKCYTSGHNYRG